MIESLFQYVLATYPILLPALVFLVVIIPPLAALIVHNWKNSD